MNYKKILKDNKDNVDLLRTLVSECAGWDGSLEFYEVHEFDDEFFNTYFEGNPEGAARAVFFGRIENWMDEYIRFNGYGNLESLSDWQLEAELKEGADEIISRALELIEEGNINIDGFIEDNNLNEEEL